MSTDLLDTPLILSLLFYPRPDQPGKSQVDGTIDGSIPVADDVVLGYRLYVHQPGAPIILYFHGNGEIASDYDSLAGEYRRAGASLLVVDYRGYGWSSGEPKVSTLFPDVEQVHQAIPDIVDKAGLGQPRLYLMGRSLGSLWAIHLAYRYPDSYSGLIIESGFAQVFPLLGRMGLSVMPSRRMKDPIGNLEKMGKIELPLLVIHGESDLLIPFKQGKMLYDASPATDKRLQVIKRGGHNDLLFRGAEEYFSVIAEFIRATGDAT
jgi:alpha-beta hydrolase superfamily lysophospholipase